MIAAVTMFGEALSADSVARAESRSLNTNADTLLAATICVWIDRFRTTPDRNEARSYAPRATPANRSATPLTSTLPHVNFAAIEAPDRRTWLLTRRRHSPYGQSDLQQIGAER